MSTKRPQITVTGADERTNIRELTSIHAEIGFLFTGTPEGRNRYPSLPWIEGTACRVQFAALHVCGRTARQLLIDGGIWVVPFERIQVNGKLTRFELEAICRRYPDKTIITQHNQENETLAGERIDNHAILVDASGGRGKTPDAWTSPRCDKPVGFAGGLGPDNLEAELLTLSGIAMPDWWVDMEGKLRVDDWFSVGRAKHAVDIFESFQASRA